MTEVGANQNEAKGTGKESEVAGVKPRRRSRPEQKRN
jgi:hypothetical protein